MDVKSMVTSTLVWSAAGAVGGYLFKAGMDILTSEAKRRQDLVTHVIGQIEVVAPTYFKMANNAYLLSYALNRYLETKRQLQLLPLEALLSPTADLVNEAKRTAQDALFYAGKLYRVINDKFWVEGGRYLLPDRWANRAIADLHNGLMAVFAFDQQVLLRYIQTDTDLNAFHEALKKGRRDLLDEYSRYWEWLLKQERQVIQTAVHAQAYADLFQHQMDRLYKDYHRRAFWLREAGSDPLQAAAVLQHNRDMLDETRRCIQMAATQRQEKEQKRSLYFTGEIDAGRGTLIAEASFNLAWNLYTNKQFQLAEISYRNALESLEQDHLTSWLRSAIHNNLGNVYTSQQSYEKAEKEYESAIRLDRDRSVFHQNLGQMYYKKASYALAVECFERAARLEPEDVNKQYLYNYMGNALRHLPDERRRTAIEYYRRAIALNPFQPVFFDKLAMTHLALGEPELAIDLEQEAVKLTSGEDAAAYYSRLGGIYASLKTPQWHEAIDAYKKAANADPRLEYVGALVNAYKQAGRLRELPGTPEAEAGKKAEPKTLSDLRILAELHEALGETEAAARAYKRWVLHSQWNRLLDSGVKLEYRLAADQKDIYRFESLQTMAAASSEGSGVAEPRQVRALFRQNVLDIRNDGNYEIQMLVEAEPGTPVADPPLPVQEMRMLMSKLGDITVTMPKEASFSAVPFPDRELRRGDDWTVSVPIPIAPGTVLQLQQINKLADIGYRKDHICARIEVSGFSEGEQDELHISATTLGENWFDFAKGMLVESRVESRVVTRKGDEEVTLMTTTAHIVLVEETAQKPGTEASHEAPPPPAAGEGAAGI